MGSCISSSYHKNPKSAKIQMSIDNNSSIPPSPIKDKQLKPAIVDSPLFSHALNSRVSPFNSLSSYRSHGSRDETFYDTQGWLESDCEDDFYSVNGDFTPSRGNTPVHPSIGTPRLHKTFSPQVNKALFDGRQPLNSGSVRSQRNSSVRKSFSSIPEVTGSIPTAVADPSQEASLKPKKKRLADLFRESMRERGGTGLSFPGYESDSTQRMESSPNSPALPPKSRTATPLSSGKDKGVSRPPNGYVLEKDKSSKHSHHCFPKLGSIRNFHGSKKASSPTPSFKKVDEQ
ncbi:hypothetical protein RND81_03G142000 [Saponaria officinalis]|uniref:Uncharacterized protein n=1 Tax=Saponaria officinalis TaxID=3572 RepID=A0AAW1M784_SAPOF